LTSLALETEKEASVLFPNVSPAFIHHELFKTTSIYRTDSDAANYLHLNRFLNEENSTKSSMPVKAILESEWSLIVNKTPIPFITTDNPGFSFNVRTLRGSSECFSHKHVFMLPISPEF